MFKLVEFEQGESVEGILSLKSIVTMNSDLPERYSSFIFFTSFLAYSKGLSVIRRSSECLPNLLIFLVVVFLPFLNPC